jgi:hypothetical protein
MAGTGMTLIILAIIATLNEAKFIFVSSVFQILAANIVINLGYLLTQKIDSEYFAVEAAIDIGYAIIVIVTFGAVFNWFPYTPVYMLIIMAIVIYICGLLLSMYRLRGEIDTINKLLKKRKELK